MGLSKYMGKVIKIQTKDSQIYCGRAIAFESEVESDSGYDEIGIEDQGHAECIDESEIASIEVIED